ncbi:MAG: histidinol-phosphate transaminase [Pseudomonadota bacterium]
MINALDHILQMAPYALAEMAPPPGKPLISLAQNESLRPPSPATTDAVVKALSGGALYPDPAWTYLRRELAGLHGLRAQDILCSNGSMELIGCIARAFAGPERAVLTPAHAYPFFRSAAQMVGARFDTAPEVTATVCVEALLQAVRTDTALVFIANPGNPTGTRIGIADLHRLRAGLRDDILLVIDEAYGEFADHLKEPVFDMVDSGATVVLRSFSKAYGMAGFRVGWGYAPPAIADEIRKVMNPNNVSLASQAAATAALKDQTYMRETCAMTAALRDGAASRLRQLGFHVLPSFTNFLLIDFGTPDTALSADTALRAEGIFLRPQTGAGLPTTLRMTIGPEHAMEAALRCLETWHGRTA